MNLIPNIPHWLPAAACAAFLIGLALASQVSA